MRLFRLVLFFCLVAIFSLLASYWWLQGQRATSSPSAEKHFLVRPGEGFASIVRRLEAEGLIADSRSFRWYARLLQLGSKLRVGEYALRADQTNAEIAAVLASGKSVMHKLTVPEGYNRFQIAEALEQLGLGSRAKFLAAVESRELRELLPEEVSQEVRNSIRSVDGYLYPDTYQVSRLMTEQEIAKLMLKRFRQFWMENRAKLTGSQDAIASKLTLHELVTLASVVEKETGAARERPLIAGVFLNRLAIRMRLQSDPTIIYGIWDRDGKFDGNIRRKDILNPTPYNTYTVPRLPLGPVANPGANALFAVLYPEKSNYLYFVSRNDGTHVFTSNYRDHSRAVNELQKNPAKRTGGSWRDLPQSERVGGS